MGAEPPISLKMVVFPWESSIPLRLKMTMMGAYSIRLTLECSPMFSRFLLSAISHSQSISRLGWLSSVLMVVAWPILSAAVTAQGQAKSTTPANKTPTNTQAKAAPTTPSNVPAQTKTAPAPAKANTPPNTTPANTPATKSTPGSAGEGEAKPATAPAAPEVPPAPDMSFPPGASKEVLLKVIATAKGFRPFNADQYKLQQTALRDASSALMKLIDNQEDPVRMQAELDVLSSNAALMTNESDEARDQVLEKIITYLKSRKQLSLADVQTGMIVGFYLELQPRKSPARDVYSTMVDLLEKDEREEMQALRINLQASVRRLEMLGNKLDLNVKTIDDKPIKTEDFAGKFVLVDFFATWCGPCIAEVPRLKRHYDKYREKGLEVVAISLDDDRQALDKYLEEAKLPWPVIHDSAPELSDKLQMKFGIASLPTVLFLNKEGVVVSLEARGAELDRLMERLFEMPTPAEPEPEAPKDNANKVK